MIALKNISVVFNQKGKQVTAVKDVSLTINQGEIFGIVGFSGAGKSTLVRVMNLLQWPTTGQVIVNQQSLLNLKPRELRQQRKKMGMIFQHFNLMAARTIANNVAFSLKYSGLSKKAIEQRVDQLLALVGLLDKKDAYPSQLSGGQKQRVAIARALANEPDVLLCDEATSALDPQTTKQILTLLKELNQRLGLTIVLITHEMTVIKDICHQVAVMDGGKVMEAGRTIDLFSHPTNPITQRFIRTATHIDQGLQTILAHPTFSQLSEDQSLVEWTYIGNQTNQPLISELYSRFGVHVSILYGNVEMIQGVPMGHLIANMIGNQEQRKRAVAFMVDQGVGCREMNWTEEKQKVGDVKCNS